MTDKIEGEFYLQGVREMASGFLLKPDHTFRFFFTYGALDRYGTGKWEVKGDKLVLNSAPGPGNDFALVSSHKTENEFINIAVDHENPMLLNYVYVSLQNGKEGSWEKMNSHGNVQYPPQEIKTISLLFEFCPERFSVFQIEDPGHNEFIFRPEPWLVEVFLDHFELQIINGELMGKHPLMDGDQFTYSRQ